jgi:hypothetical protein
VLCPRSVPSMKRFIRSPAAAKNQRCENHMKQGVFTQPGSKPAILAASALSPFYPSERTWPAARCLIERLDAAEAFNIDGRLTYFLI